MSAKKRKVSDNILRDDEGTLKTKSFKADYPLQYSGLISHVMPYGIAVKTFGCLDV